jgi:hypothetical protein
MGFLNPNALGGSFAVQTARPLEWLFVLGSFALLGGGILFLRTVGRRSDVKGLAGIVLSVDSGAERTTGVAPWAGQTVLTGLWALLTAFIGFVWDVGWHADTGRDRELFTVPHILILVGLAGIVAAALVSIWTATRNEAPTGWRFRRWHVPYASVPLLVIGGGALLGFPLDDLWHAAYGIDVTMWSPTHLLMIGGASLSPLPLWLILSEAGVPRNGRGRMLWASMAGVVLVGLSTLQLEFDMGIPQWQAFYHPLLIAAAAGICLVAARSAIGPGGAVLAAVNFLVLRILMALLVGGALGRSLPHFPLYLGEALCVEAAFWLFRRRAAAWQAVAAGLLLSTVGLATEDAWVHVFFQYPWHRSLLPFVWMFLAIGLLGAVVGLAMGRVLSGRPAPVRAPVVAVCLAGLFGLLVMNLGARHADAARVTLKTTTVGTPFALVNRDGVPTISRDVSATVSVDPPAAAEGADWFEVLAWQGGPPVRHFPMIRTATGQFRADGVIPTGGNWKSLVLLHRGNVVEAVPLAFPADPAFNLPAVDPPSSRSLDFAPSSRYLMREFKGTVVWPAIVITGLFALVVLAWVTSTALAFRAVGRRLSPPPGGRREPQPRPGVSRPSRALPARARS